MFDWHKIFVNDLSWRLAGEVVLRTFIMFTFILIFLRLSGKQGVRQLSILKLPLLAALKTVRITQNKTAQLFHTSFIILKLILDIIHS